MIAVSDSIPSCLVLSHDNMKLIIIEIPLSIPLFVGCLYIPPLYSDSVFVEVIDTLKLLPLNTHVLLLGDLNLPLVDWATLSASSPITQSFCDEQGFIQDFFARGGN